MTTRRRLVQMMVVVTSLSVGGWLVISASTPGDTASAPIDAGAIATTEVKTQTDAGTDLDDALFREGVRFMGGTKSALGGISGGAAMGDAEGLGGLGARGGGTGGGGTGLGIGGLGTRKAPRNARPNRFYDEHGHLMGESDPGGLQGGAATSEQVEVLGTRNAPERRERESQRGAGQQAP